MRRISQPVLFAGALLALVSLCNCGASRAVNYYVLDVDAPTRTAAAGGGAAPAARFPVTLVVGRIITTHLYRDDRLVYGSGPVELGTYEYHRWAEPPAEMIQDILIASLRATGQYRSVSRMATDVRGDYILRGRLTSLYEVDKPKLAARFSVQIELFDPKTAMTVWNDSYSHDEPVEGKKVEDVVEALDRNVRAGMEQLTTNLGQFFASRPPQPK
jgi:ABC-type uncharacterized transport system auxiliary subunit